MWPGIEPAPAPAGKQVGPTPVEERFVAAGRSPAKKVSTDGCYSNSSRHRSPFVNVMYYSFFFSP